MELLKLDIQRFADGKIVISTELDTKNFERGINTMQSKAKSGGTSIKNIVAGLGITKLIGSAFNAITKNMDSAISRLDTMNNFPKVMSNLGISAKDSEKAIKKLSNGLVGIPTSLDAGAMAVQRFTSKNGDVQKSVDIFLAVNDAILAGGASTEIQASALEQLSQAYSKGKMDMMEWRTLQTAMPAQLKQVASAMGLSVDELGEMMRQGDKTDETMQEFISTIITMDKKGVKGFKSLSAQARNATGGIRTNITNMNTAIVRGLANVVSAFDKGLKKAKLGSLGDNISKIGKLAENVLKKVASSLEKINWQKVISSLKSLADAVLVVVAGITAYNTIIKITQALDFAKDILSATKVFLGLVPAIQSATVSQTALNLAMSVNPVGLIVAGVTALIAGLTLLAVHLNNADTAQNRVNKTLKDYNKAMGEADKTRQDYLDKNMNELSYYENLGNELKNITDANGRVQKGYEKRAQFIVTTLNDALGTELKITNGVVQNYDKLENKIKSVINQKRAMYLLDAQESKYNTAKDQRNKLEKAYNEAIKLNQKAIQDRKKAEEDLMKTYGLSKEELKEALTTHNLLNNELGLTPEQITKIRNEMFKYDQKIKESDDILAKTRETYTGNEKIIAEYENALGYMSDKNYSAVLKMYEDTTNYVGKTDKATYQNYQTAIDRQKNYLENLKANKSKYDQDTYNSLLTSGQATLKELQNQQSKYRTATSDGQKKVKEEWNKSLAEQLTQLTGANVKFKKTGDGHIQAYINGQKTGKPMSQKEAKKFGEDMAKEIDKAKPEAKKAGQNLIKGTRDGINNRDSQNSAFGAISSFGQSLLNKLKSALKEKSPSKATQEMGEYLLEGINIGVQKEEKSVFRLVEDFGKKLLDNMYENIIEKNNIGETFSKEIGDEFDKNIKDVYDDIQNKINAETDRISTSIQSGGTYKTAITGSQNFYLKDNSTNQTQLVVNGRVLAEVVNTENRNREVAKA